MGRRFKLFLSLTVTEAILAVSLVLCLFVALVQCQPTKNYSDFLRYRYYNDHNNHDDYNSDFDHKPDYDPHDVHPDDYDWMEEDDIRQKKTVSLTCAYYEPDTSGHKDSQKDRISGGKHDNGSEYNANYSSVVCEPDWLCYTLWGVDERDKNKTWIRLQGCWTGKLCNQESCVAREAPKHNISFCCCDKDMCNVQYTDAYRPQAAHTQDRGVLVTSTVGTFVDPGYREKTIIIALVSVIAVALVVVFTYLPYRLCLANPHARATNGQGGANGAAISGNRHDNGGGYSHVGDMDWDMLKLDEVLVRGQFGEVWKGTMGSQEVAIKIYEHKYKHYYHNEVYCYTMPFMDHENVVKFYGAREYGGSSGSDSPVQYQLVLQYHPAGSLTSYLKLHTIDWTRLFAMGHDIASGLVYLHTDITNGDDFKPALAHRDLNSRNILVTSDLRCVLTDLGFCTAVMGSKLLKDGKTELAEQGSLTEVGTIRYLAPEVFDGAVDLRDCEASLKQVDMYSLGLVLWEVASRCVHLYQGAPMPDYQLPFQAEAGLHPTFHDMQSLVVRYKTRPKFPQVWKDTNPAVRSLKETVEDCWDSDPEARLTALCVQERLLDMTSLWQQGCRQRGVMPTLNSTKNHQSTSPGAFVSNGMAFLPEYVDRNLESSSSSDPAILKKAVKDVVVKEPVSSWSENSTTKELVPTNAVLDVDDIHGTSSATSPLIKRRSNSDLTENNAESAFDCGDMSGTSLRREHSMSGSTMDTWIPPTPSTDERNISVSESFSPGGLPAPSSASVTPGVKASNVTLAMNNTVRHPHQGRNPTVERNTHKSSDEELSVSGNQLLGPKNAETTNNILPMKSNPLQSEALMMMETNRTQSLPHSNIIISNTYDPGVDITAGMAESSSLVQHDSLNHQHQHNRNAPIPYLQNQVHGGYSSNSTRSSGGPGGGPSSSTMARPKVANLNGVCVQGGADTISAQLDKNNGKSLKQKLHKFITSPRQIIGSKLSLFAFKNNKNTSDNHNHNHHHNHHQQLHQPFSPSSSQSQTLSKPVELAHHHHGPSSHPANQHHATTNRTSSLSIDGFHLPLNETVAPEYHNGGLQATPTTPTICQHPHPSSLDRPEITVRGGKTTTVQMVNGSVITCLQPGLVEPNAPPPASTTTTTTTMAVHRGGFTAPSATQPTHPHHLAGLSPSSSNRSSTSGAPLNVMVPTNKPHTTTSTSQFHSDIQPPTRQSRTQQQHEVDAHKLTEPSSGQTSMSTSFNSGEFHPDGCRLSDLDIMDRDNLNSKSDSASSPDVTSNISTNKSPVISPNPNLNPNPHYKRDNNHDDRSPIKLKELKLVNGIQINNKHTHLDSSIVNNNNNSSNKDFESMKYNNAPFDPTTITPSPPSHQHPTSSTSSDMSSLSPSSPISQSRHQQQRPSPESCFIPIQSATDCHALSSSVPSVVIPLSSYPDSNKTSTSSNNNTRLQTPHSSLTSPESQKCPPHPPHRHHHHRSLQDITANVCSDVNDNKKQSSESENYDMNIRLDDNNMSTINEKETATVVYRNHKNVLSNTNHHPNQQQHQLSRPKSLPIKGGHHYNSQQKTCKNTNERVVVVKPALPSPHPAPTTITTSPAPPRPDLVNRLCDNSDLNWTMMVIPTVSLDKLPDSQSVFKSPTTTSTPLVSNLSPTTNNNSANTNGHSTNKTKNRKKSPSTSSSSSSRKAEARSSSLKEGHRSDSSEKIRRRIKTPVSFKNARLSLYDDRLMTQSLDLTFDQALQQTGAGSPAVLSQSVYGDGLNGFQHPTTTKMDPLRGNNTTQESPEGSSACNKAAGVAGKQKVKDIRSSRAGPVGCHSEKDHVDKAVGKYDVQMVLSTSNLVV